MSPRVFRVVALPVPSDREKTQTYMQHFPAAGEIVIFDRSWYNRAGVEHVPGFCTKEQHRRFLEVCPLFEKQIVEGGDPESRRRWYDYSRARDLMLAATDAKHAPWSIVRSDDKKRARLDLIAHLLGRIPYKRVKRVEVKPVDRSGKNACNDELPMRKRSWIPGVY